MGKPALISGIQPTGQLHIGNYLGALKNFVDLQNSGKYRCFFFIADLHSLTESYDPRKKSEQILELAANYLAAGLDAKQSTIFLQSQIPAHSELTWILNTITPMGELRRMTQFKDKAGLEEQVPERLSPEYIEQIKLRAKDLRPDPLDYTAEKPEPSGPNEAGHSEKGLDVSNVGLFDYPVLMAADIILYDAKFVPVGDDQLQHLELARSLARKFNNRFGKTFTEPQPLLTENPRVMSLNNPSKKMSKSEPAGCLFLDDSPAEIEKKIKRAVTDSGSEVRFHEEKPAISNLIGIYSDLTGLSVQKIEKKFKGKGYGEFKADLARTVADHFADFRAKKAALAKKPDALKKVLLSGSAAAEKISSAKIAEVKKKMGLAL